MTRRSTAATIAAAALVVGVAVPAVAQADPLAGVRDAVARLRFSATVTVQWVDGGGTHHMALSLQSDRGRVRVDGPGDQEVLWS
ncbi:MAG TPA: hypothetical protein VGB03_02370, partial [Acidimicrobiales bacterium]